MFVDNVDIFIISGRGGAGAVSFRREKFVLNGGPDGGDGGDGGDVYFQIDSNADTLSKFRGTKYHRAKNGQPGKGKNCSGKKGEDIVIKVPPGTQIFDFENNELLYDFTTQSERIMVLKGGKGGFGNVRFKNSVNQRPTHAQNGLEGQERHIRLELKLIADIGLVGFPNVGKSTLISILSNAKPEIANYEFTTITPHLGVVEPDDINSFVIADIPGIIDGASEGRGLGIEFLRHVERTKILLFVIDGNNYKEPLEQYKKLRNELKRFSTKLSAMPFGIVLSKTDIWESNNKFEKFYESLGVKAKEIEKFGLAKEWKNFVSEGLLNQHFSGFQILDKPLFIIPISSINRLNTQALKFLLLKSLHNLLESKLVT